MLNMSVPLPRHPSVHARGGVMISFTPRTVGAVMPTAALASLGTTGEKMILASREIPRFGRRGRKLKSGGMSIVMIAPFSAWLSLFRYQNIQEKGGRCTVMDIDAIMPK